MKSSDVKTIQVCVEQDINDGSCVDAVNTCYGLVHVNRFSKFLQTCDLIYARVNAKLIQLKSALQRIKEIDDPLFTKHEVHFLELALKKTGIEQETLH